MSNQNKQYFALGKIMYNGKTFEKGDPIMLTDADADPLFRVGKISETEPVEEVAQADAARLQTKAEKEAARKAKGQEPKAAASDDAGDNAGDDANDDAGDKYDSMSAADLKDACEAAGLPKSGSKADMVERLRTAEAEAAQGDSDDIASDL